MPLSRSVVPTAIGSGTWNPGFIALAWVLWEKLGTGAGGTRTRAAVVDEAGRLRGAASGPGANPVSHAPERAVGALAGTLQAGLDAAEVRGLVLGLAGAGRGGLAVAEPARAAGLSCPVRVVGDAVTAFAAGTAEPDGTVPVAGAGAAAARIVARREAVVADALVAAVAAVRDAADRTPIVLAGRVVAGDTPVAARTRAALEQHWPGRVRTAGDPARAAAWLASVTG